MKAIKKLIRSCIPPLILCFLCFLLIFPTQVTAADDPVTYTTIKSKKNDGLGVIDYGDNFTVDYIIQPKKCKLVELDDQSDIAGHDNKAIATVVIWKENGKDEDGKTRWKDVTNSKSSAFVYDTTTWYARDDRRVTGSIRYVKKNGVDWGDNGHTFSDYKIDITFPEAALCKDGTYKPVTFTITNIWLKSKKGETVDDSPIFGQNAGGAGMYVWKGIDDDTVGAVGCTYKIKVKVENGKSTEKVFIGFKDLDQPGFDERNGTWPKSGVEGIRIDSGIFKDTVPHVPNNTLLDYETSATPTFIGTKTTDNPANFWQTGLSFIGKANGVNLTWAGRHAMTYIGVDIKDLPNFVADTSVRVEAVNSPATISKESDRKWDNYEVKDSKDYFKMLQAPYSYTYTVGQLFKDQKLSLFDTHVFNYSDTTKSSTAIKEETHFYIDIKRKRWTWSFNSNLPTGAKTDDLSGMPSNKKVVASYTSYGMADPNPSSPTLKNYQFIGWYSQPSLDISGEWYPTSAYITSNRTWYAIWVPFYYFVVYHDGLSSDNTWTTGAKHYAGTAYYTHAYNSTYPYIPVASDVQVNGKFYKRGYHLYRWRFTDGSKTEYYYVDAEHPIGTDSITDHFKDLTKTSGATVHVYAEWAPNTYYLRVHENYNDSNLAFYDVLLHYDEQYQLPKPPPWDHPALVYGYDPHWDTKVSAEYRCGKYVKNLTDLYGKVNGIVSLISENPGIKDLVDDRSKPIIELWTIWDRPPTIELKRSDGTPVNEIHLSQLKVGASVLNEPGNTTVSRSALESELMTYCYAWDYEWDFRYKKDYGEIKPGEFLGYTLKIAAFEPADIKQNAKDDDADTYYVTFEVTDDANQSAQTTLTLYVGNTNVDILVH